MADIVVVPGLAVTAMSAAISLAGTAGACVRTALAACERASIAGALIGTESEATDAEGFVATESVHAPRFTPRIKTRTVPMNFERNMCL